MAIAFDTSTKAQSAFGASSLTYAHTCTGANLLLWVFVFTSQDGSTGDLISGVTYNGVSMTRATGATMIDVITGQSFYVYYLAAPATGANTVVITATGSVQYGISSTAQSYTGAKQTGIPDATNTSTSGGTISVTTIADNCWLASGGRNINSGPLSAGTGTTLRQTYSEITTGDSNGAKTPAGAHSMGWTPGNISTKLFIVSFAPAPPATVARRRFIRH